MSKEQVHTAEDESLLYDAVKCNHLDEPTLPSEAKLQVTKWIFVRDIRHEQAHRITLSDGYYAPLLQKDLHLIANGRLKKIGCQVVDLLIA